MYLCTSLVFPVSGVNGESCGAALQLSSIAVRYETDTFIPHGTHPTVQYGERERERARNRAKKEEHFSRR